MDNNDSIQLSLDFAVIKNGTKVRIDGYDCHQWLDLTNCVGVIYLYSQSTGDYLVYFPGKKGIVPDTKLILRYRRQQLEIIQERKK
ncbi:hypothetical protein [Dulcicalothrix desertica]|nr:hypothetical protein [Dulcicalothrix desertica]TWH43895.1 hypothetical protein CAL7102_07647 [Dulcicalothrix desertica PCC 7102]